MTAAVNARCSLAGRNCITFNFDGELTGGNGGGQGIYDAVVSVEGTTVVLTGVDGKEINSGIAGVDDLTLLNSLSSYKTIFIKGDLYGSGAGYWNLVSGQSVCGTGSLNGFGVSANGKTDININGVTINDALHDAIVLKNCSNVDIGNVIISSCVGCGIRSYFDILSKNVNIHDFRIVSPMDCGIHVYGVRDTLSQATAYRIHDGVVSGAGAAEDRDWAGGIVIEGIRDYQNDFGLYDLRVSDSWESGVHVEGVRGFTSLENIYTTHNGLKTGGPFYGAGVLCSYTTCAISRCVASGNLGSGFILFTGHYGICDIIDASDCISQDNGAYGVRLSADNMVRRAPVCWRGGLVAGNGGPGIRIGEWDAIGREAGEISNRIVVRDAAIHDNMTLSTGETPKQGEIVIYAMTTDPATFFSNIVIENNDIRVNNAACNAFHLEDISGCIFRHNKLYGTMSGVGVLTGTALDGNIGFGD